MLTLTLSTAEEITIAYTNIYKGRSLRQEDLDNYGFKCTCPACDMSTTFGKASEKRRKRLAQVDRHWYRLNQMSQALALVMASINIMKAEGLYTMKLSQL